MRNPQDQNVKNSDINFNSFNDNVDLRDIEDYDGIF